MSGKTGSRPTGRKPAGVRRQSGKTGGAFGKETREQVTSGDFARNPAKAARRPRKQK
jgi:hypothetical protein